MARSRAAGLRESAEESGYREIERWYRDQLANTAPPVKLAWNPVYVGPTWQHDGEAWILPESSLGWRILAWCGRWLRDSKGQDWQFTMEQARFLLWFYAVDSDGRWLHDSAVLQRLKGWGKDPIAACMAAAGCFAPVTFDHWNGDTPVGREEPNAWVQCVAVSLEQTKNTMKLFPSLLGSNETRQRFGIQVGKLNVWGMGDTRQIEAVTSSPLAIEGGRPTLVIRNETQNWNSSNGGHDMAGAIEGNVAKSQHAAARILDICNAYRPGDDSVGERVRDAWEATQGEDAVQDFGLMYDSLEAPPEAPLTAEAAPSVVESIRGDATWLNTKRIVNSILNLTNSASESRRKWYNQIVAAEDARFDPLKVALCRTDECLSPGDEIVLFGDGSKNDDASGLVACRMRDGLVQLLHVQEPKKRQIVSRPDFDLAVRDAFDTYKVLAFWFDPGHIIDETAEGDERFWWPLCDTWALQWGRQLKYWPVLSGNDRHAIIFDMSNSTHVARFTGGVEVLDQDITNGTFRFRRSDRLERHLKNARRAPNKHGISMQKNHRESAKKIDLAVCAAGARMLWRHIQMAKLATKQKGAPGQGRVIVLN